MPGVDLVLEIKRLKRTVVDGQRRLTAALIARLRQRRKVGRL